MLEIREGDGWVSFRVRVVARASRTDVAGEHDGALRVRVAAPPVDGAANEELIRFLARSLRLFASAVEIESGHTSRTKLLLVRGASAPQLRSLAAQRK